MMTALTQWEDMEDVAVAVGEEDGGKKAERGKLEVVVKTAAVAFYQMGTMDLEAAVSPKTVKTDAGSELRTAANAEAVEVAEVAEEGVHEEVVGAAEEVVMVVQEKGKEDRGGGWRGEAVMAGRREMEGAEEGEGVRAGEEMVSEEAVRRGGGEAMSGEMEVEVERRMGEGGEEEKVTAEREKVTAEDEQVGVEDKKAVEKVAGKEEAVTAEKEEVTAEKEEAGLQTREEADSSGDYQRHIA
ncbi:hypothetical protein CYMTET_4946 [Cymbomonas tetramitiformis]|uniref:Uncharacterized protein n=1 Tax=Cymbomonas tetramitiformis TaxID=36881 RepID=A0AAE0LJV3_9CHLO|nr:hypothetical protein CYMTET_4946 [Cymbomonas tetramitiformis]